LAELNDRLEKIGYKQENHSLFHEKEKEQKDPTVFVHSEKLAVVFGLMSLPPSMPLRVIKNLRVCNDCHTWMKFTSEVMEREIALRDVYRSHHFNNGNCSCGDFW
jgi:hypothetical protein